MSHPGRIIRRVLIGIAYVGGTASAIFVGAVLIRAEIHAQPVSAASSVIYPSFCLGGWDHPQHASGPSHADTAAQYTNGNSAYLASQVSSQLFCGYFDITDKTNPPSNVRVKFNWDMRSFAPTSIQTQDQDVATNSSSTSTTTSTMIPTPASPAATPNSTPQSPVALPLPAASSFQSSSSPESYTATASSSAPVISPSTGLIPVSTTPAPTSTPSPESTPAPASAQAPAAPTPVIAPASTPSSPAPVSTPAPAAVSTPTPAPTPAAAPASTPSAPATPAAPAAPADSSGPSSFIEGVLSTFAYVLDSHIAYASANDPAHSSQPFLSISYSVDGVRWVSVGTVGSDNWKNYSVAIPVSSWDDVRHLQIMINVMPTIDPKPEIYLESIAAQAEYARTTKEALSDTVSAVGGAVSTLADAVTGTTEEPSLQDESDASSTTADASSTDVSLVADTLKALPLAVIAPFTPPPPPPKLYMSKRVLQFALSGDAMPAGPRNDIKPTPSGDGSSLTLSGSCTKKYYVVLVYKSPTDYQKKQSSFVANEARDCVGGTFTYDVSALPPELKSGTYYVMTADEDDTGPWTLSSKIFPVTIQATTTTVEVSQSQ